MSKYKPQEDRTFMTFTRNKGGDRKEHLNLLDNGCIMYSYEDRRSFVTGEVKDIIDLNTQEARFIMVKLMETINRLRKELRECTK